LKKVKSQQFLRKEHHATTRKETEPKKEVQVTKKVDEQHNQVSSIFILDILSFMKLISMFWIQV
jgi:hypothetical protein